MHYDKIKNVLNEYYEIANEAHPQGTVHYFHRRFDKKKKGGHLVFILSRGGSYNFIVSIKGMFFTMSISKSQICVRFARIYQI